MKVLALIATLLFAGAVSADSHTTGTPAAGHGDAAHAEKPKDAKPDAKTPAPEKKEAKKK